MQAVGGVVSSGGQQVQVMQMNQAGQVIQGANGQQIMVHAVQQPGQAIQVAAAPSPQGLQQIQVVPVSSLQTAAQGQIVIQQPQQTQIIQTADGQTYIYQPVPLESTLQQAQPAGKSFNVFTPFRLILSVHFQYSILMEILYKSLERQLRQVIPEQLSAERQPQPRSSAQAEPR